MSSTIKQTRDEVLKEKALAKEHTKIAKGKIEESEKVECFL